MARSRSSNNSDWFRKDDDVRWQWSEATWTTNGSPKGEHNQAHQFASPKRANANFACVQHFIHHLAPHGMAGFVLANGSMSSNQSGSKSTSPFELSLRPPRPALLQHADFRLPLVFVKIESRARDQGFR
jgi:hypothetical protein